MQDWKVIFQDFTYDANLYSLFAFWITFNCKEKYWGVFFLGKIVQNVHHILQDDFFRPSLLKV